MFNDSAKVTLILTFIYKATTCFCFVLLYQILSNLSDYLIRYSWLRQCRWVHSDALPCNCVSQIAGIYSESHPRVDDTLQGVISSYVFLHEAELANPIPIPIVSLCQLLVPGGYDSLDQGVIWKGHSFSKALGSLGTHNVRIHGFTLWLQADRCRGVEDQ